LVAQGSLTGAGSGEEVVPAIHQKSSNARNSDAHRLSFERAVFSN
jgi:hypothetical protein